MNHIETSKFSNPESEDLYLQKWPTEYPLRQKFLSGLQCGGCTFYAPLNTDWGLCCAPNSRHRLETVFEHFTCASHVDEGWGAHSFSSDGAHHCRKAYGECTQPGPVVTRYRKAQKR